MLMETEGLAGPAGGGFHPEVPRNMDRPDLESSVQLQSASFRGSAATSQPSSAPMRSRPVTSLGSTLDDLCLESFNDSCKLESEVPQSTTNKRAPTPLLQTDLGTNGGLAPSGPRNVDRPDLESSMQLMSASFRGSASRPSSAAGVRPGSSAGGRPLSPGLRSLEALEPGPLRHKAGSSQGHYEVTLDGSALATPGYGDVIPVAPVSPATPPLQRSGRARLDGMRRRPGSATGSTAGSAAGSSTGSAPPDILSLDGGSAVVDNALELPRAPSRSSVVDRAPVPPAAGPPGEKKRTPPRPSPSQRPTRPASAPGIRPATQGRGKPQFTPLDPSVAGEGWMGSAGLGGYPSAGGFAGVGGYPSGGGGYPEATAGVAAVAGVTPCTPTNADRKLMMGRSGRSMRSNVLASRGGRSEETQ